MPVPIDQLILFLGGSILITIVRGPDMALVFRQVLLGGTALAQRTIFGNLSGLVVHAVALAAGLSALLAASAEAYTAVKLAGAVYLVYLGVQTLRAARHAGAEATSEAGVAFSRSVPSMRTAYVQGLVSTVLYKLIKHKTLRLRPFNVYPSIVCNGHALDQCSFPSGHTLHAVSFSIVAVAYFPALIWLVLPFTVLVALSRPILGLHYPSDVLVGALIGALLATASFSL